MDKADYASLISDLQQWNNGDGIDVESWVGCVGNLPLAIGFGSLFWPRFVLYRGYVLFASFSETALDSFIGCCNGDRRAVEATMNHRHLLDFFCDANDGEPSAEPNDAQLRHFGRLLREMWQAKVKLDLPAEDVVVSFQDEPVADWLDWIVTVQHREP